MSAPELQAKLAKINTEVMTCRVELMQAKQRAERMLKAIESIDTAQSNVPALRNAMIALIDAQEEIDAVMDRFIYVYAEIEVYKGAL